MWWWWFTLASLVALCFLLLRRMMLARPRSNPMPFRLLCLKQDKDFDHEL